MCADCPDRLAADLEGAFPTFLAHHQDLVFGMALRLTHRSADAEDLAQDAFVRAYRALREYDGPRTRELRTRGWLAAIVRNLARDRARRQRPEAPADEDIAAVVADEAPGPEAVASRREEARAWRRRLGALPPRYRDAVTLRHVDGLAYPELAIALGRPVGTVKSDVHRGVRLLREALEREGLEESG